MRRGWPTTTHSRRAPAGITAGCELWLHYAEDIDVDWADRVLRWGDISGRRRDFAGHPTDVRKPVLTALGIEFDGNLQEIIGPSLPMSGDAPRTIMAVYEPFVPGTPSGAAGQSGYVFFSGAEAPYSLFAWTTARSVNSDPAIPSWTAGEDIYTFPRDNVRRVVEVSSESTGYRVALNDSAFIRADLTINTTPGQPTLIGNRPTGSSITTSFYGRFRELAAWSRLLTQSESMAARLDMMNRNGVL